MTATVIFYVGDLSLILSSVGFILLINMLMTLHGHVALEISLVEEAPDDGDDLCLDNIVIKIIIMHFIKRHYLMITHESRALSHCG